MIHFQRIFAKPSKKEDIAHPHSTRHTLVKAHAKFAVLIYNQYLYQSDFTYRYRYRIFIKRINSNMFSEPYAVVSSTNSMSITSAATARTLHTPDNKATTPTGKCALSLMVN